MSTNIVISPKVDERLIDVAYAKLKLKQSLFAFHEAVADTSRREDPNLDPTRFVVLSGGEREQKKLFPEIKLP